MMSEAHEHEWKKEYYGLRCSICDLFYPDTGNWFAPPDEEDDEYHSETCTCETCIQDYPERLYLLDDEDEATKKCGYCGEMNSESNSFCWSCEGEI
jgi:hypothetical protein